MTGLSPRKPPPALLPLLAAVLLVPAGAFAVLTVLVMAASSRPLFLTVVAVLYASVIVVALRDRP